MSGAPEEGEEAQDIPWELVLRVRLTWRPISTHKAFHPSQRHLKSWLDSDQPISQANSDREGRKDPHSVIMLDFLPDSTNGGDCGMEVVVVVVKPWYPLGRILLWACL